jgi:hypothetical protein
MQPERCREDIMIKWLDNGHLVRELPSPQEIRDYVLKQLQEAPDIEPR